MELTAFREVPPKMRSAPVVMGMIAVSSGSVVLDDDVEDPVDVEHADDGERYAVHVDRLTHGVLAAEELGGCGLAQDHDGMRSFTS